MKPRVSKEVLDAGTWLAEMFGVPRKDIFRAFTAESLVAAYRAKDPSLTERRNATRIDVSD